MRCAVKCCKHDNRSKDTKAEKIMFFRFPADQKFRKIWTRLCGHTDILCVENKRLCSVHFCATDYQRYLRHELLGYTIKNCRKLKPDAVPSLNLGLTPDEILKLSKVPDVTNNAAIIAVADINMVDVAPLEMPKANATKAEVTQVNATYVVEEDVVNLKKNTKEMPKANATKTEVTQVNVTYVVQGDVANLKKNTKEMPQAYATKAEVTQVKATYVVEGDVANLKKITKDVCINTDMLSRKIAKLEAENSAMRKLFSENQIKKLRSPKTRIKWTEEDIAKSIDLYTSGEQTYHHLLKLGYPLPAVSTLRNWV